MSRYKEESGYEAVYLTRKSASKKALGVNAPRVNGDALQP